MNQKLFFGLASLWIAWAVGVPDGLAQSVCQANPLPEVNYFGIDQKARVDEEVRIPIMTKLFAPEVYDCFAAVLMDLEWDASMLQFLRVEKAEGLTNPFGSTVFVNWNTENLPPRCSPEHSRVRLITMGVGELGVCGDLRLPVLYLVFKALHPGTTSIEQTCTDCSDYDFPLDTVLTHKYDDNCMWDVMGCYPQSGATSFAPVKVKITGKGKRSIQSLTEIAR